MMKSDMAVIHVPGKIYPHRILFRHFPACPEGREVKNKSKYMKREAREPASANAPPEAIPSSAVRPRVLLADDHALVLEGLAKLVAEECDLVGKVVDGRTLIQV